jgi:hypothetical protein
VWSGLVEEGEALRDEDDRADDVALLDKRVLEALHLTRAERARLKVECRIGFSCPIRIRTGSMTNCGRVSRLLAQISDPSHRGGAGREDDGIIDRRDADVRMITLCRIWAGFGERCCYVS